MADATNLIASAAASLGTELTRDPQRTAPGPHEVEEFGPALRKTVNANLIDSKGSVALLDHEAPIADWNRPTTRVDLVVRNASELDLVAELKVWDVGHQLFDVAKVCCLLKAGAGAGFLLCIAKTAHAFDSSPGGELFPAERGLRHDDVFPALFQRHLIEARKHLKQSRPRPVTLPRRFSTIAVCDPVALDAYPGHQLRAVEVAIEEPTPIDIPAELIADG